MPQRAVPRAVPKFGMVTRIINGITHYGMRIPFGHPLYGSVWSLHTSPNVVINVKDAMCGRIPPWRLKIRNCVPDYLLADVAMELGYDVEDVLNIMSGRAYNWKS